MRNWLFHPLIFYPLALLFAAFAIAVSVKPQAWPRTPAPVAADLIEGSLVFSGAAFNSPAVGAEQDMTVVRDFWGLPQTLRIAQLANQPPPTPAEQGARLLLTPEQAALIEDRPVTVEVSYRPLTVNAASGMAVSLQGIGPAEWVSQDAPSEPATLRFELPAQFAVNAIGLRALSNGTDQAYGLEITRVRVTPHP
ncbi:MAG: hypothetical protein H7124_17010 [Phycisphaerales bacterium]|nr:hypothetical protein [Hyphomonadaceae bacterium]